MSEPLRIDSSSPTDTSEGEKDARIEQLLLSGLDHYFAGEYEQAINIWTRVVFLERGHDRARAYIERARSALAERHRESEELLHRGVAAFDRGQTDEARALITRAVEEGGPHDLALVFLERLNRLGTGGSAPDPVRPQAVERRASSSRAAPEPPPYAWPVRAFAVLALISAVFTTLLVAGVPLVEWVSGRPAGETGTERVYPAPPEPLPIAQSSAIVVERARALRAGGHLRDALRALESVDRADPLRAEADRLRGEIQSSLLEAGRAAASGTGGRP